MLRIRRGRRHPVRLPLLPLGPVYAPYNSHGVPIHEVRSLNESAHKVTTR